MYGMHIIHHSYELLRVLKAAVAGSQRGGAVPAAVARQLTAAQKAMLDKL